MWAHDVNARGALLGREVEIVSYDDQSDPDTSARLYERLISDDKVDLLIGPYSSDVTLAPAMLRKLTAYPWSPQVRRPPTSGHAVTGIFSRSTPRPIDTWTC